MIFQALVRGDPDNSLQGDFPWKWLWILFPFPFLIPGAAALLYTVRRRATAELSPEAARAAAAAAPAPREEAGVVALAPAEQEEAEYPTVPTVGQAPGSELAVRLVPSLSAGCSVAMSLTLFLLCSGVVVPLVGYSVRTILASGGRDVPATTFFGAFGALAWVLLSAWVVKEWRVWRLGMPLVEVSAPPLHCGEPFQVHVTFSGPARMRRLRVAVVCEEAVSYTEGTTTRKETRLVHDEELLLREDFVIERDDPLRVRGSCLVPAGAMHAFKAEHNEVRWLVRVEGVAQRLFRLKFKHDYPLPVRPPRGYGGRT
jgi:hypothetical protein